jgi:hypothetical protein
MRTKWSICSFSAVLLALVLPAVAQQTTKEFCSPAIENVTGNIVTNCYNTIAALKKGVSDNLEDAILAIRQLLITQRYYMFPSLDSYMANPTEESWEAARRDVDMVSKRIVVAVDAVVTYNASLEDQLGDNLARLHDSLRSRPGLISMLPRNPPPKESLTDWIAQYRVQVARLNTELSALEARFKNATFKPSPSRL